MKPQATHFVKRLAEITKGEQPTRKRRGRPRTRAATLGLSPCLYCGEGAPHVMLCRDGQYAWVQCGWCGARGPWGYSKETAAADAVRYWNQRSFKP